MKQVGNFQTIEHFWRIYNHMLRPSEFKTTTDFHLFKYGIKPTWEDPQNERGGKWMVRLKKGLTAHYWEELIIAIIGEQFDVGHEICGAVVSVRNNEDIISVWNKNAENTEAKNKIRDQMRRILKLPAFINVEYKKHQDSLVDKSSFRNTVVWRSENAQDRDRGPRKPRTDWSDRGEHSGMYCECISLYNCKYVNIGPSQVISSPVTGNDRSHGHRHERSKDSSAGHDNSHSPRGFQYNSRGDKDKDKDASTNSSSSSSRTWQSSGNSTSSSTWKSPRNTSSSSTSPRNQSAWGTASSTGSHSARSSKPSPTTTPSASASAGGGWFRGDASKTDGRGDKSADSAYVPLGGSRQQGGERRV